LTSYKSIESLTQKTGLKTFYTFNTRVTCTFRSYLSQTSVSKGSNSSSRAHFVDGLRDSFDWNTFLAQVDEHIELLTSEVVLTINTASNHSSRIRVL